MTTENPAQITSEQFAAMTDDEIVRARRLGLLDAITGATAQLTQADLASMTPEAITAAYQRGATATLTGARVPRPNPGQGGNAQHSPDPTVQLDKADLRSMSPESIAAAQAAGQLDNLMGRPPRPVIDPRPPVN